MTEATTDPPKESSGSPVAVVPAIAMYLASIQILLAGGFMMDLPYEDPGYARAFLPVEAALTLTMLAATFLFFKPSVIGLRWPSVGSWKRMAPIGIMLAVGLGVWIARWAALPEGAERDLSLSLGTLATTLLVGFTEEWMYRGLLPVLLVHWLGFRRGLILSLVLFGGLHLANVVSGMAWWVALIQVPMAALSGSVFLLAAIESRSLLIPMVGHALWDFFLVDTARGRWHSGLKPWPASWSCPCPSFWERQASSSCLECGRMTSIPLRIRRPDRWIPSATFWL